MVVKNHVCMLQQSFLWKNVKPVSCTGTHTHKMFPCFHKKRFKATILIQNLVVWSKCVNLNCYLAFCPGAKEKQPWAVNLKVNQLLLRMKLTELIPISIDNKKYEIFQCWNLNFWSDDRFAWFSPLRRHWKFITNLWF